MHLQGADAGCDVVPEHDVDAPCQRCTALPTQDACTQGIVVLDIHCALHCGKYTASMIPHFMQLLQ